MILQAEVNGIFSTNAYFYVDDATRRGFLIDPGAQAEELMRIINDNKFTIEKILITHGHYDHIGAVPELQARLKVPVCMQRNGRDYTQNPLWNLSGHFGMDMTLDDVTYIDDYSDITLTDNADFGVKLIPLAGHTTDGAVYYSAKDSVAFVGDSIFLNSFGRTDFPGGDEFTLYKNLKEKVLTLPEETILLSGHSEPTTVGNEKNRS